MHPDQTNIQLLIAEKEKELKTLEEEWKGASRFEADMDYEYLALLYPIIAEVKRDLEKLAGLASDEYTGELHFPALIRQLLNGECLRLELHVTLGRGSYIDYKGPLMTFEKMKQKNAIGAKLLLEGEKERYFYDGYYLQLGKLGWKKAGKHTSRLKHIIRNNDELNEFHSLIACTLMEPLFSLTNGALAQYFVVIPLPQP